MPLKQLPNLPMPAHAMASRVKYEVYLTPCIPQSLLTKEPFLGACWLAISAFRLDSSCLEDIAMEVLESLQKAGTDPPNGHLPLLAG